MASIALSPAIAPTMPDRTPFSPPRPPRHTDGFRTCPTAPWRRRAAGALLALGMLLAAGCQSAAPASPAASPEATLRHADHALVDRIWDVATRRFVTRQEALDRLRTADAVLLGETHDNPVHHRLQAELLTGLIAAGRKPVVVMEQFDTEQQAALDAADSPAAAAALMPRGWDATQYRPILDAARRSGLALAAGNVSRAATRPVIREGWQAVDAARRNRLRVDTVWDAAREGYMRTVITASHCGQIDDTLRDGLVRAQRLRDAVLADVALATRPAAADGSTVFIVGRGHARSDVGVPRYLRARSTSLTVLSVGFTEVSPDKTAPADYLIEDGIAAPGAPHDLLWFTPRQTRPDPCKDFGKR